MKLVIVSCVSPPEPVVAGRVNRDIAEMLSDSEDEVILITPHPSRPLGKYNLKTQRVEVIEVKKNFRHIRLNSFLYPKYNLLFRSFESWDFGYKAIKYINKEVSDADIIYATPWPFLGQYAFIKFNRHKNIPIIMNIQDLYPESLFTKIKSKWLIRLLSPLYSIDKYIARHSTHITVVSENLKDVYLINRGINANKITVLENWQDESAFIEPIEDHSALLEKYQLQQAEDTFIFMYLGNIGPVAGLKKVIKDFGGLGSSKYTLIIAGSGTAKGACIELVNQLNLSNVMFTEVAPGLKSVVELQSIADVLLLPINTFAASSSVPSKLIAYMFSSKAIISSAEANSDTGKVILESNCGWLLENTHSWNVIMEKAASYTSNELQALGNNGYKYAMERFSKAVGLKKIKELIEKIR
jgi:glycosyltransferase involved in cell wall biosynthesis